jgi:hypothetical protein
MPGYDHNTSSSVAPSTHCRSGGAGTADAPAYADGLVVRIQTDDAPLADLARQCEALIAGRVADLARQLNEDPPPWTLDAPPAPGPDAAPELHDAWRQAMLAVAVYRDTWQVTAPTPLGPVPVGDRRRLRHFEQTHDQLAHWRDGGPRTGPDLSRPIETDPHADIDFEAFDPGDHDLEVPQSARFIDYAGEPPSVPETWPHDTDNSPATPSWRDDIREPHPSDPARGDRIATTNAAAWDYWRARAATPSCWVRGYLTDRGLADAVPIAHAPAGWTTTIDHLRNAGFTDASISRTRRPR